MYNALVIEIKGWSRGLYVFQNVCGLLTEHTKA